MKDVVFLGPSLPVAEARRLCDAAEYRPPVQMGDVYRAVSEGARRIAIIDGLFERVPAVWHKEILFALAEGVTVIGGGSMGALRAAELQAFGMIGVGAIFEDFRSGALNDDDEVAVVHTAADSGFRALSTAMVNLRAGLALAERDGIITGSEREFLVAASKQRFYPDRSWAEVYRDAALVGLSETLIDNLKTFIKTRQPDQKRDDAIAVLEEFARGKPAERTVDFKFEKTVYWQTVETYCSLIDKTGGDVVFERIRNHARLFESDRDRLIERALLFFLIEREARREGIPPSPDRAALTAFRRSRGLMDVASLSRWIQDGGLTQGECLDLARTEHRLSEFVNRYTVGIDTNLKLVLRLDNRYDTVAKRVGAKWAAFKKEQIERVAGSDAGSFEEVIAWYEATYGRINGNLTDHVVERGFGSFHQWREEIYVEYLSSMKDAGAHPVTPAKEGS